MLGNFLPLESRTDVGVLRDNYLMSERRKLLLANGSSARGYFWRTTGQQEVDYIEETSAGLTAYEFTWRDKGRARVPRAFRDGYPDAGLEIISPENAERFSEVH